jgi:serine/threonine protein kinase
MIMVLELAKEGSLDKMIPIISKMARPLILRVALEMAKGMQYLHKCGLVHMDFKSQNVLVCPSVRREVEESSLLH